MVKLVVKGVCKWYRSTLLQLYAIIVKPGTSWSMKEACLFVMHAVAPSIRS